MVGAMPTGTSADASPGEAELKENVTIGSQVGIQLISPAGTLVYGGIVRFGIALEAHRVATKAMGLVIVVKIRNTDRWRLLHECG